MAYNKINKLQFYIRIMEIVNAHYEPGVSTYRGIWKVYVSPRYPMSYHRFMEIVNMPNLRGQLEEELRKVGKRPG